MKSGSWPSVALIYLYGVLAAASLTKLLPLQQDLETRLGVTDGFQWLFAMIGLPSALLATVAGTMIDRIGGRSALIAAAAIGALVNFAYMFASTEATLQVIRVTEGLIMVGVYSAAPALIMATTSDARRGRAMAIWSTYTPVGVSLGLLLSSGFAGGEQWRSGYLIHGVLFAGLMLAGLLLPQPARNRPGTGPRPPGLLRAFTQQGPLRVALVFATLVFTGLGTSAVLPGWYAAQQQVSLGAASGIVGIANLTMIAGGVLAAFVLARGMAHLRLFVLLILAGLIASAALFWPGISTTPRVTSLVAWLVISGACIAVVTAMLPKVVVNPLQGASAAGLLSQLAAATTFVTPLIWIPLLAANRSPVFIVLIAAAGLAGMLLFPRPRHEAGRV